MGRRHEAMPRNGHDGSGVSLVLERRDDVDHGEIGADDEDGGVDRYPTERARRPGVARVALGVIKGKWPVRWVRGKGVPEGQHEAIGWDLAPAAERHGDAPPRDRRRERLVAFYGQGHAGTSPGTGAAQDRLDVGPVEGAW